MEKYLLININFPNKYNIPNMIDDNQKEPCYIPLTQSNKDYISSELLKFIETKDQKVNTLEKKLRKDIQTLEVLKYKFCDMLKFVETETEELEMLEISLSTVEPTKIDHIQEEDENSNSDSDLGVVKTTPKIFAQSEPSNKLISKNSDSNILTRDKSFDELTTKYDYSKINLKRDDKKIDELSAKYDYSRVATKRPTNLEKQFNISNNSIAKKESDKKATVEPFGNRRDDKKQSTIDIRRRGSGAVGGNLVGLDKSSILKRTSTGENINEGSKVVPQRNSERKTSILVIPGKRDSIGLSSNGNKSFTGRGDDRKTTTIEKSSSINYILNLYLPLGINTASTSTSKQDVSQAKILALIQKLHKKQYNNFSTTALCAIHLTIRSGFLEKMDKYKLITNCEEIYEKTGLKSLSKYVLDRMTIKVNYLEDTYSVYLDDPKVKALMNKPFIPTKTAEHGLSFIKKEDEVKLKNFQEDDIIEVFKFIYVLIEESYEDIEPEFLIENLFNNILPRLGCGQLFMEYVIFKKNIDDVKFEKLYSIIQHSPNVLSSHYLIKLNRCVSYMTFFLKEIFDYNSMKTTDGMLVYKLRNIQNEISNLAQRILNENEKSKPVIE